MQRRWRRLARWLIVLFAVYFAAGNVFLNSPLGPWAINRKPERFALHWSHGFTWWPGFAMLWQVEARGHVRHVAWTAQARRVHGRVALSPLLARELRIPSIDATDVELALDRADEDIAPMPYRPGGWRLRLDRIATDSIRHARIGPVDVEARGRAAFGFFKQLRGGPMEVLPSHAELEGVRVAFAQRELLRDARVAATLAIARHRRDEAPGLARIALTDAELRVDGILSGLAVELDPSRRWIGRLVGADGKGRLRADLALHRGTLAPGGMLEVAIPLEATRAANATQAKARLQATVQDDAVLVHVDLPPPPEGTGSIAANLRIAGTRIEPPFDRAAWLARVSGTVDADWRFDSLAWIGPLLVKAPWLALEGAGRVQARLAVEQGRIATGSRVAVPDVALSADVAGYRFAGRAKLDGRLDDGEGEPRAAVRLELPAWRVAAVDAPGATLLQGRDLALDLAASGHIEAFRDSMRARLAFRDAEMPDLRAADGALAGHAIALLGGRLRAGAQVDLDADGAIRDGRIDVAGRRARLRFGAIELGGDFDLDARLAGTDLATRHVRLDGTTLRLRNIAVADAGRAASERWWANLALGRGRIVATAPFTVDATADIAMQNVGLLLALFSRRHDFPGWALRLVDAGSVQARGRMRIEGRSVVFDRVEASNDRFDAKARLRVDGKRPRGDLYLGWRALGLGLELDGGTRRFHFVRPAAWYEARKPLLPAR